VRVFVFDYSGHPFQVQLSRELARRGHEVTHGYSPAYPSGKGKLEAEPGETLAFATVGGSDPVEKDRFVKRLLREVGWGFALFRAVRRTRADVALISNTQIPTLVIFAALMWVVRKPWVLWHQDVYAVAVKSFAGEKLGPAFRMVAACFEIAERWCSRRAAAIVVIAESFVPVHERWGTAARTTVIPNWAPLDEIVPLDRKNDWAVEQGLDDVMTLVYSGTLGLKHNPVLLVRLARAVLDRGRQVQLVVVSEGPAMDVLREEAARLDVPVTLLPFQPYERLSEVLASGDILTVLLEPSAGAFSVPSKTLSYLCAGRPVLGLIPAENLAADLVTRAGGHVEPATDEAIEAAAAWAAEILGDPARRTELGHAARALAEEEFALSRAADGFEKILAGTQEGHR